jgi:hypothetical protein
MRELPAVALRQLHRLRHLSGLGGNRQRCGSGLRTVRSSWPLRVPWPSPRRQRRRVCASCRTRGSDWRATTRAPRPQRFHWSPFLSRTLSGPGTRRDSVSTRKTLFRAFRGPFRDVVGRSWPRAPPAAGSMGWPGSMACPLGGPKAGGFAAWPSPVPKERPASVPAMSWPSAREGVNRRAAASGQCSPGARFRRPPAVPSPADHRHASRT